MSKTSSSTAAHAGEDLHGAAPGEAVDGDALEAQACGGNGAGFHAIPADIEDLDAGLLALQGFRDGEGGVDVPAGASAAEDDAQAGFVSNRSHDNLSGSES